MDLTFAEKNSFLISLSMSPKAVIGKVAFEQQSEAQKVFTAIWVLESEGNNGGFAQYFSTDVEGTALHAPIALGAIGATQCAAIVTRALAAAALPDTAALLEKLDQEFFQYPDNLTELLYSYVMANPAALIERSNRSTLISTLRHPPHRLHRPRTRLPIHVKVRQ